jgi:GNAT superfamily N-acetyltransferase
MTRPAESAHALLTDGTEIEIRPLRPGDVAMVHRLYQRLSPESRYLRFFSHSPTIAGEIAERACLPSGPGHAALSAWLAGELVGVAGYEPAGAACDVVEISIAVADSLHHRGVGTLLLEHLVSLARSAGVKTLLADTLAQNHPVLRIAAAAGLAVHRRFDAGVVELQLSLAPTKHHGAAVPARYRGVQLRLGGRQVRRQRL